MRKDRTVKEMVLDSARELLVTGGIDALRSMLNLNRLAPSVPASRTAVYKSFTSVDELIVALGAYVIEDVSWGGYADAAQAVASAYFRDPGADSEDAPQEAATPEDRLKAALQTNFDRQMMSPATPALWLLLSAIASCSPEWKGAKPQEPRTLALAHKLLEQRRGWYDKISSDFLLILGTGMSDLGLRPRADVDPRSIVVLLQCLHDGATLRRLFDPESVPSDLVADAMLLLGIALGERGVSGDPRRSRADAPASRAAFDRMLEAVESEWSESDRPTVNGVADSAGVPLSTAEALFRTDADLYDSLARKRIIGGEPDLPDPPDDAAQAAMHFHALKARLLRVVDTTEALPGLMSACSELSPVESNPIIKDLIANAVAGISPLATVRDPDQLAEDVFTLAMGGRSNWLAIEMLLRTAGPPS